ncbi:MAG: hypothetical protein IPM17_03945 [Verrucomicrobia bacterium]|nr:hypothetical protein [Verrucomicrobiota bacterium]
MSSRLRRLILLGVLVLFAVHGGWSQRSLRQQKLALIPRGAAVLGDAPPALAMVTVAFGGFRGLVVTGLWLRLVELQERGQFFEARQLASWITQLHPESVAVWRYQAWNLAYNLAGVFSAPEQRWPWVEAGISLLRDHALRYNPVRAELYTELATFFQHKLGMDLDPAHRYYKEAWATRMAHLLGRPPDLATLANPQSEKARERVRRLREELKMDPEFMLHVDSHYGPFDWRLPEAHAVYWADLGLERCGAHDALPLRRVIWQAMLGAFKHGRLIENAADQTLDFGPNLALIHKVHEAIEEAMAADPDRADYIGRAHRTFHEEAVVLLYTRNRRADAETWFQNLRREFPQSVPEGQDLDAYVIERVTRIAAGSTLDRVRGVIEGLLITGYQNYAVGEDEAAVGYVLLARQIWRRHQARFEGQEERAGLPPFEALQQDIVQRVLRGETLISAALAEQIRRRAGLDAPPDNPL